MLKTEVMRNLLLILTAFIALSATTSGIIMVIFPDGSYLNLPQPLLANSPFSNYFIPGLILFAGVGGSAVVALCYLLAHHNKQYVIAIASGIFVTVWIVMQMVMTQVTHWLQFLYLFSGLFIMLIAYQLKGKWAV